MDDGTQWKYTQDHGKSGASIIEKSSDKAIICIGDINRMYSQYNRGGGTACFQHQNLWYAFNSAFANHDECGSNGRPKKPKRHHHHHSHESYHRFLL